MIYFTSDDHFFHKNILEYCSRPWSNVDDMNQGLVERWNEVVKNDKDLVYVEGDVAMHGKRAIEFLARCRGRKRLIRGNHDFDIVKKGAHLFEWIRDYYEVTPDEDPTLKVVLFHYPIEVWNNRHRGWLHFHGHSHGSTRADRLIQGRVDIGVDCWDWKPVTFEQARARAMSYKSDIADHHDPADPR